jgi:glycosyltransferase involved in cell wall biosynthesis
LAVPLDITIHDFHLLNPDPHEPAYGDQEGHSPALSDRTHDVRAWQDRHRWALDTARRIIAPSHAAKNILLRMRPDIAARIVVAWHPEPDLPEVIPCQIPPTRHHDSTRVLILGHAQRIKGREVAGMVAAYSRENELPFDFLWVGLDLERDTKVFAPNYRNYGGYEVGQIPQILNAYEPDVLWFPSQVPETYCYALSEALRTKLPMVASRVGAFIERLKGRRHTILVPPTSSSSEWLEALASVRDDKTTGSGNSAQLGEQATVMRSFYSDRYFYG